MDHRTLYLDLLKRSLLGLIDQDPSCDPWSPPDFHAGRRSAGLDWPLRALTMVGEKRMDNLWTLVPPIIDRVPGDFVETGVWRGGASIFARAVLDAYDGRDRLVWCCDSFAGLPAPSKEPHPTDATDCHHTFAALAAPLPEVRANFLRYRISTDRVRFVEGWFEDTLPTLPVTQIAVLRLDGDMYGSTITALTNLYPKVSQGGAVIVDDYHVIAGCRAAVDEYRMLSNIPEKVHEIDGTAVYWIKGTAPEGEPLPGP